MFQRACRILKNSEPEREPSTATSSTRAATARWSEQERLSHWKSLLLKVFLLFQTIAQQTKSKLMLGETVYNYMFQTKVICPAPERTQSRFVRGEAVGKPLPRGEGKTDRAKAHVDPVMCLHPDEDMLARGNKTTAWWTCKKCNSRWERTNSFVSTHQPTDLEMVRFGKHAGTTFQDLYANDLSYCLWAVRTAEEEAANPGCGIANQALKRLAAYCCQKQMEESYEADDFDMEP
jgi:hypothetical protein